MSEDDPAFGEFFYSSYFIIFPYFRETVQSVTTRMGLDATIIGLLRRGEFSPRIASTQRRTVEERAGLDVAPTDI